MMGGGDYKKNYGAQPLWIPRARISRYAWLEQLRNGRKRVHDIAQRLSGTFRN
ncbi:MAG TPA: hypothetical protein VFD39_14140 [Trueperaceae bacterium]|nr:hypothetical protein [Trueperaceae bacterium]